jgi:hypothetical protein
LLKRRISSPRAATAVVLAAVVAISVTVVPAVAQSFLTNQRASKVFVSNKKANSLFLKKRAASNMYLTKKDLPWQPVAAIAAGNATYGPVSATTAGFIPTAFTSFATPAKISDVVISFSGSAICTSATPGADQACPIQILVDGQSLGKVNLAPATAATPTPIPNIHTVVQTTVLNKGGHTVAVQYAGASKVTFTLKSWNLAVQAYPQPE